MKKLFVTSLCIIIFSCFKTEIVQYGTANTDPAIFASGQQLPTASRNYTKFCNPNGWGRKGCKFLSKYDDTIWADAENYYSEFSDIKFLNDVYFISFLNINNDSSFCKGWKTGETANDGIKWNIKIKKDEWDELWFDYDYYGASDEIEYSVTYKYEVIDSLLHFSNT
ncbi:hypothetical protein OAQ80_06525, partial [Flavobacteriaceae bacterium]|nr:hypothetical protein [Flavobacteriaceae bacterium]